MDDSTSDSCTYGRDVKIISEKFLQIVYSDKKSLFPEFLEKDGSVLFTGHVQTCCKIIFPILFEFCQLSGPSVKYVYYGKLAMETR